MGNLDLQAALSWLFYLALIGFVAFLVVADNKKKAKKAKEDNEMLLRLSPEDRSKILAERAEQKRQAQEKINQKKAAAQQARKNSIALSQFGPLNPAMVCPHCQSKGKIRTKAITQKKGISGGKATAAVVTGGLSILAVGLSRKEASTQAHCDNCNNTWLF